MNILIALVLSHSSFAAIMPANPFANVKPTPRVRAMPQDFKHKSVSRCLDKDKKWIPGCK